MMTLSYLFKHIFSELHLLSDEPIDNKVELALAKKNLLDNTIYILIGLYNIYQDNLDNPEIHSADEDTICITFKKDTQVLTIDISNDGSAFASCYDNDKCYNELELTDEDVSEMYSMVDHFLGEDV